MSIPLRAWRNAVWLGAWLAVSVMPALPAEENKAAAPDADVTAGWDAFHGREDAKARAAFEKAIKRGVAAGYAGLGMLFQEGAGVEQNEVDARRLFEHGAAKKDPASIIRLAKMLGHGRGGAQDMERARELLNDLLIAWQGKEGDIGEEAQVALMSLEQEQSYEVMAEEAAAEEQKKQAELAADTRPGADEYREGLTAFEQNEFVQAHAAWKRAAGKGHPLAFGRLGRLYQFGEGIAKDEKEARRLYEQGAAKDDPEAMFRLAVVLVDGVGGPKDLVQSKRWYEKALAHPKLDPSDRSLGEDAVERLTRDIEIAARQKPAPPRRIAMASGWLPIWQRPKAGSRECASAPPTIRRASRPPTRRWSR